MSLYSIEHIVKELFEERQKTNNTPHPAAWKAEGPCITVKWKIGGAQAEIYWQTWSALNEWIESQLAKKQGATVPNLGSFTWEKKGELFRPIFLISESFLKSHRVKRKKSHKLPEVAPSEDINYSKIAIKFTDSMTKDMIFSGTRDIVRKIGDYFDFGYQADIDFSFGTLMLREKRVKFEFNLSRLMKILPENAFAESQQPNSRPTSPRKMAAMTGNENQLMMMMASSSGDSVASSGNSTIIDGVSDTMSVCSGSTFNTGVSTISHSVSSVSTTNSQAKASALPKLDISKIQPIYSEEHSNDPAAAPPRAPVSPIRNSVESINSSSSSSNSNSNNYNNNNSDNSYSSKPPSSAPAAVSRPRQETILGIAAFPAQQSISERSVPLLDENSNIFSNSNGGRPISPGLVRVLMSLEEPKGKSTTADKLEARKKNVLKVQKDAYLRNITSLEKSAEEEEKLRFEEFKIAKAFKEKDTSEKGQGKADTVSLKATLDAQIKAFEEMKMKQKQDFREASISQLKGVGEGFKQLKILSKEELHKELSRQIRSSQEKKHDAKISEALEQKEYLEHIALENDLTFAVDRAKHLERQRTLLDAWERDTHIRNMKKLTQQGPTQLKDYINSNGVIQQVVESYI